MPLHATLPDLSLPGNLFALHFAVHPRDVIMVIYETVRVKWWLFINGIEHIVSGRLTTDPLKDKVSIECHDRLTLRHQDFRPQVFRQGRHVAWRRVCGGDRAGVNITT